MYSAKAKRQSWHFASFENWLKQNQELAFEILNLISRTVPKYLGFGAYIVFQLGILVLKLAHFVITKPKLVRQISPEMPTEEIESRYLNHWQGM